MTAAEMLQQSELGELLSGLVRGVVQAQDVLDQHASALATQYVSLPDGTLEVPPLWYTVKDAMVDLELSATVRDAQIICSLVNPTTVGLFGREAAATARVRLVIGPSGMVPVKTEVTSK
jgi:hypothetical protein